MEYFLLIIGFVLLIKGADFFVDGCISVANKFHIPPMVIGLTIVAMGTSAPEAAVSIAASIQKSAGIAVGNIIGSNIFNLLVVIGICLFFIKMDVSRITIIRDYPIYIFSLVLLLVFSVGGVMTRLEGAFLLALMFIYMFILVRNAKQKKMYSQENYIPMSTVKTILFIVIGGAAIVVGGEAVVNGAKDVALSFGLSEQFIGLSIVAVGTSLPELVTSLVAVKKNECDIAVGNIIGSNIFNTLFVIGMASAISPVTVSADAFFDVVICLFVSLAVYGLCLHKKKLTTWKGCCMLLMYAVFFVYILTR